MDRRDVRLIRIGSRFTPILCSVIFARGRGVWWNRGDESAAGVRQEHSVNPWMRIKRGGQPLLRRNGISGAGKNAGCVRRILIVINNPTGPAQIITNEVANQLDETLAVPQ